jgi:hypothetical protein
MEMIAIRGTIGGEKPRYPGKCGDQENDVTLSNCYRHQSPSFPYNRFLEISNPEVAGSSPAGRANKNKGLGVFL